MLAQAHFLCKASETLLRPSLVRKRLRSTAQSKFRLQAPVLAQAHFPMQSPQEHSSGASPLGARLRASFGCKPLRNNARSGRFSYAKPSDTFLRPSLVRKPLRSTAQSKLRLQAPQKQCSLRSTADTFLLSFFQRQGCQCLSPSSASPPQRVLGRLSAACRVFAEFHVVVAMFFF